jgi:hypothetical protein
MANEGSSTAFDLGSFADPDGGPWSVDVNWGDSSTDATFTAASAGSLGTQAHTYADNATYTVTVTVTDSTNLSDSKTFAVTVANVAPSVANLIANDTVLVNQSLTVSTTFSDPGPDFPWQATFNWGDGASPVVSPIGPAIGPAVNIPLSLSHSYSSQGGFIIKVDVTDKDGDTGSSTKNVKVVYGVVGLFAQSGSGKSYKLGSTIPVKIQVVDANGNVSSPAITVQTVNLTQTSTSAPTDVLDSGNANPDSDFRFDSTLPGYIFNLSTKNLTAGTWTLSFTVNGQSDASYFVTFDVR